MYVYGGQCGGGRWLNELVVLDADALLWSRPRAAPPRARSQHAAAIVGTRLLIFGGAQGGTFLSDLSILDAQGFGVDDGAAPLRRHARWPPPAADALSSAVAGASSSTVIVPVGEEGVPAPKMKKGVTFGASSNTCAPCCCSAAPKRAQRARAREKPPPRRAAARRRSSPARASTALVLAGSRKSSLKRRGSSAADFPAAEAEAAGVGGGVARRAVPSPPSRMEGSLAARLRQSEGEKKDAFAVVVRHAKGKESREA